jgi:signal transduction histidine kinase
VLESKKQGALVIRDCTLNLEVDGRTVPANYRVSSKPFEWNGEEYFVVTLEDNSSVKRKEQLERTFFHDIKNKAGTVQGFLNLLKYNGNGRGDESYVDMAVRGITELLDDVEYQRILMKAEAGDLKIYRDGVPVQALMANVCSDYQEMADSRGVTLDTPFDQDDLTVYTDPVLINRVLSNLVKNAIEASSDGDRVVVTCTEDARTIDLIVRNPKVMPEEVRMQVFNRSFSTKGIGRGIGTYSIKLLTEEYLEGKVDFTSEEPHGTKFRVTLPLRDIEKRVS